MSPPFHRTRTGAYAAMVVVTLLWGSNPAFSRLVLEHMGPFGLVWFRWAIVLALLAPFVWPERAALVRAVRTQWRTLLPFAVLGFAPQNMLVFTGLAGSSAMHLSLLNSVIPVLIILIGWGWHGRRPHGLESAGLALSLAGVLLIIANGELAAIVRLEFNPWDLLMLAGMAVWALFTIRLKDRPENLSLPVFVFAAALIGELLTLPILGLELVHRGLPEIDLGTGLMLLYIAALPTLVAMLLFGAAVKRIGPLQAGILSHLVPVFGSVFNATLLGERLYPYLAVGFVLVAGGAILSCLRQDPVLSSRPSVKTWTP